MLMEVTLVEALQWLFEAVWDNAVPIAAAVPSDSDPRRQMLVSLLMAGSTDSAIASNLGVNVRSVRRWIAELMDQLGVTTRLQLGAALVRVEALGSQNGVNATSTGARQDFPSTVNGPPQNADHAGLNGLKPNGSSLTAIGANGRTSRNGKQPQQMPILRGA